MARIFISYKRVNKDKVFEIKDQIEFALGEKCWIDLDGIESDAQFKNVIIKAINDCEIVLFMYSQEHSKIVDFEKDWTVRELSFASAKGKRTVFVNIDGSTLTDEFLFDYGNKQQVDAQSQEAILRLITDLGSWLCIDKQDSLAFDEGLANTYDVSIIGVGGGGGNVVNHMFCEGSLWSSSYYICNTDFHALNDSPIYNTNKIQLGKDGLSALNRPEMGFESALYSIDKLKRTINDDSKLSVIVTCLGGGTGTGAAPLVARTAKNLGKTVIGVATIPFRFEGAKKTEQAINGIKALRDETDALILIPMQKLIGLYGEMNFIDLFGISDNLISNIINNILKALTSNGQIYLNDQGVLESIKNGGIIQCFYGKGDGEHRLSVAIDNAEKSPLNLHDDCQKIFVVIRHPHNQPVTMTEFKRISEMFENNEVELGWGIYDDLSEKSCFSIFVYRIDCNLETTLKSL